MTVTLKSLITPPSLLFPIGGAVAGYVLSRLTGKNGGSGWAAAFGAAVGALWNAGASGVQMENVIAGAHGINLSDNSLSFAARGFIGKGAATPIQDILAAQAPAQAPAQAASGGGLGMYPIHHGSMVGTPGGIPSWPGAATRAPWHWQTGRPGAAPPTGWGGYGDMPSASSPWVESRRRGYQRGSGR